jgi:thiamine biosynthesis lipoprotein
VASVTLIASEGIVADAAATALVVAGLDGWPAVARALDLNQVLVVDESGKVYLTPEMEQRVQFSGDVERITVEVGAKR